jgi:hypothetical protein
MKKTTLAKYMVENTLLRSVEQKAVTLCNDKQT